jgi:moderate conductance mechanosensitive channel
MRTPFRVLAGFLLLISYFLCTTFVPVRAQSNPPATQVATQELINDLVNAISTAVVEKLKKDGSIPAKSVEPETGTAEQDQELAVERVTDFVARAEFALSGYPELWRNLTRIPSILDKSENSGRGLGAFFAMLCIAVAAALGSEALLRKALDRVGQRFVAYITNTKAFWPFVALACLDALGLAAVWLVSYGFLGIWFRGSDEQARLAAAVVSGVFFWRFYMFVFRIFFRPRLAEARLAKVNDQDAWAIYWRLSAVILLIIMLRLVFRILTAIKAPPEALSAWQLTMSFIALGLLLWAAWSLRKPVAAWLASMASTTRAALRTIAWNWLAIAVPLFVVLFLAQIYGAVTQHFAVPTALLLTLNLIIALLLFETLLHFISKRIPAPAGGPVHVQPRARDVVVRCVRVAVYIGVIVMIAERWIVDVVGLIDASQWRSLTRTGWTAGGILFLAYVSWETVHFLTDSYIARQSPVAVGQAEEEGAAPPPPTATRLATILPLIRVAAIIVIFAVAALLALSELGINVTALIAAMSIFGLALSFGSQTLVKDVVSGIFYLGDDAFRVGEYIECGSAKGTVEGFTLRSIKLRHQNGQIYTIPFGQLGQIVNFSRDWCTIKFNLRFARNTDIETLRKTVKKVGLAMLEEPEFKDEFLSPLKLQGVADVADNALIMRFKFTAKPKIPTLIQREAMKRLFTAFKAAGIEFASATVSVQTVGGQVDQAVAAGAAASAASTPALTDFRSST